ncbi:MAG TPA: dTMP kinase, partial [Mycobacteriales bacterium]
LLGALRGRPLGHPDEERYPGGLFVVFEGGEGAGKSTQAVKLAAWLRVEGGRECVLTREPGATPVGARIRGILLDKSSEGLAPRAEALLYAADRAHHVASVIRPALARGEVVISDRYVDSSLAYQGAGRALRADEVAWLSSWATGGLVPDLVVLLDVDPAVGLGRVSERGEADRLEAEAVTFHRRVRASFLDLAARDPQRYLVLDAAGDPDAIAGEVRRRVTGLLGASAPEGIPTPAADCVPTEPAAGAEPAPTAPAAPAEPAAASVAPAGVTDPPPIEWAATAEPAPAESAEPALAEPAQPAAPAQPVPAAAQPAAPAQPAPAAAQPAATAEPATEPAPTEPAPTEPAPTEPDAETTAVIPLPVVTVPAPAQPAADATLVMPALRDEPEDGGAATKSFPAVKEKTLTSADTTEELPRPAGAERSAGGSRPNGAGR